MSKAHQLTLAVAAFVVAVAAGMTWVQVVQRLRAADPVAVHGTPAAIVWSGRVFRSEAELAAWFGRRGIDYERWVAAHPAAVSILRPRGAPAADASSGSRSAAGRERTRPQAQRKGAPASEAGARIATPLLIALAAAMGLLALVLVPAAASRFSLPLSRLPRPPTGSTDRDSARPATAVAGRLPLKTHLTGPAPQLRHGPTVAVGTVASADADADDLLRATAPRMNPAKRDVVRPEPKLPRPADVEMVSFAASQVELTNGSRSIAAAEAELPDQEAPSAETREARQEKARVDPAHTSDALALAETVADAPPPFVEGETELLEHHARIGPASGSEPSAPAEEAVLKPAADAQPRQSAVPEPALPATRPRPRVRDAGVHPLSAVAEPAASSRRTPGRTRGRACEVRWWRGYVTSQFFAVERREDETEATIAQSPTFRWRKSDPPPETPRAVSALAVLVKSLQQDGWTVSGRGDDWFSIRLRAPAAPAVEGPPEPGAALAREVYPKV